MATLHVLRGQQSDHPRMARVCHGMAGVCHSMARVCHSMARVCH